MKRFLKILCLLIVLVTLIGAALLWAVITAFPQDKLRSYAADQIGKSIHREVVIGRVHLRWDGITLDGLSLSEVPSFKAGSLFEAKGVHLGWNLRNLWQGFNLREGKVTRSSGSFKIQEFKHPNYIANDFHVDWSLSGLSQNGTAMNGWVTLKQGKGALKNLEQMVNKNQAAKGALTPVLAMMSLERSGVVKLGLPDLRNLPVDSIDGDYAFDKGVMTIRKFQILSPQLSLSTVGTVELASGKLLLDVQLHAPQARGGPLDAKLQVTGTTADPKVDLSNLKKKAFQATLNNFINDSKTKNDVGATLKSLFK